MPFTQVRLLLIPRSSARMEFEFNFYPVGPSTAMPAPRINGYGYGRDPWSWLRRPTPLIWRAGIVLEIRWHNQSRRILKRSRIFLSWNLWECEIWYDGVMHATTDWGDICKDIQGKMFRKISLEWVLRFFHLLFYLYYMSGIAVPTYFQIFLWKKSMSCTQQIK